jgi:integrase
MHGDGRWKARVSIGKNPKIGRYLYKSRSMRGSRKQAEAALQALIAELDAGRRDAPADVSVGELIEQWLDLTRDTLSVTTWEAYAGKARFRVIPVRAPVGCAADRRSLPRLVSGPGPGAADPFR